MKTTLAICLATCIILLGMSACSTAKKEQNPLENAPEAALAVEAEDCIHEAEYAASLRKSERTIDRMAGKTDGPSKQVVDDCRKKAFERKGYRVLFFRDSRDPRRVRNQISPVSASRELTQDCRSDALATIDGLGVPYADRVLSLYREKFPFEWTDLEIGPAHWLKCRSRPSVEYYSSTAMLLHEVNHDLRQGNCIYVPSIDQKLCFELEDRPLPLAAAKLKTFPAQKKEARQGLSSIQDLYLSRSGDGPVLLFDELNAYVITADLMTATLSKQGEAGVFSDGEAREAVLSPLFMLYAVRYLDAFQRKSPKAFGRSFGPKTQNRKNLETLLEIAERSYQAWLAALSAHGKTEKDFERSFWRMYRDTRKRVLRPAAQEGAPKRRKRRAG